MKTVPSIHHSLLPLSWLYRFGVNVRNLLFDKGVLKEQKFDVPIICVGNLTVGGTGKTPHIEYLIRLLESRYRVAVVSRGYKRKTKGYRVVSVSDTPYEAGDEPLQIKQKFPDTIVAVDKDRRHAIQTLLELPKEERPQVILLDDGFQHRYVKPSLSILLVDSNRPVFEDKPLPAGHLREPIDGKNRAGMVIVTKCDRDMQPIDFRIYANGLNLYPYQDLFFSRFDYGNIIPVFDHLELPIFEPEDLRKKHVLLVTGIANPKPLEEKIEIKTYNLYTRFYPDHYFFKQDDIDDIVEQFNAIDSDDKIVLTTEKDAVRFRAMETLPEHLKAYLYYIPVEVEFTEDDDQKKFNTKILHHVRNHQTDRRLSKR